MIPEGWKTFKLNEITSKIGDGLHGTPIYDEMGEYYFINGSNLVNGKIELNANTKRVSEKEFSKYKKELSEKTILIGINGTIGNIALYNNEKCILGKSAAYLNVKENFDKRFLKYLLLNEHFQKFIRNNASGTTIKNVGLALLREYEFIAPESIEIQCFIASILSSLDDKIELNLQMNKTLEAIAQAIFKEWFVDFRFPGFDGVLVDGLPKGWKKGELMDICSNIKNQYNPKSTIVDSNYVGLEHIPRKNISLLTWGHSSEIDSQKSKFMIDDVLFGKLRPYFHKVVIAPFSGICSTDILVIRAKENHCKYYSLLHLSSNECIQYANSYSDGTRMPRVNWSSLSKFPVTVPTEKVLLQFQNIVNPFIKRIKTNIFENITLIQLRDTLLPKLMTGKIKVA
jgi:type I restriction enzyme S subunit